MLTIRLRKMQFFARHGVFDFERTNGGMFTVSVVMQLNSAAACCSDRLEDTVNYAKVYDLVKTEMEQPSNLIEHVAGRIVQALFREFPLISRCRVRVRKNHPPIEGAQMAGAEAELEASREDFDRNFRL